MPHAGQTGIVESNPNTQTIKFAGRYLNLSAISRAQGLHPSFLSMIFRGKRTPSLDTAIKLAAVLGMTLDEFVQGLEERVKEVKKQDSRVIQIHLDRVAAEDTEDLNRLREGKTIAPRVPAYRETA